MRSIEAKIRCYNSAWTTMWIVCVPILLACNAAQGYSYNKYNSPISDEDIARITVPPVYENADDDHGYDVSPTTEPDFTGKKRDYSFSYGVDDPDTGNSHGRYESREGDVVRGEYSLVEPDGYLRKVFYTSDPKNGFRATVEYIPPAESSNSYNFDRVTFPPAPEFTSGEKSSFDRNRLAFLGSPDDYVEHAEHAEEEAPNSSAEVPYSRYHFTNYQNPSHDNEHNYNLVDHSSNGDHASNADHSENNSAEADNDPHTDTYQENIGQLADSRIPRTRISSGNEEHKQKKPPISQYYRHRINVESSTAQKEDDDTDFPPLHHLSSDVADAPDIEDDEEHVSQIADHDDDDDERK